jgi:hypothetical protein
VRFVVEVGFVQTIGAITIGDASGYRPIVKKQGAGPLPYVHEPAETDDDAELNV